MTPSYNQAAFLQDCIDSVLSQSYPNLQYVIMDGGSTDESVRIIRQYEDQLSFWVSESDAGQYAAINKGFEKTNGEIMGWLNSDDKYTPWAFRVIAEIFDTLPQIEWLTSLFPLTWNADGIPIRCGHRLGFNAKAFFRGENLPESNWYNRGVIQQESTFWRRSLWERCGGFLDTSLNLAADFELWARFFRCAELYGVATPIAGFRAYGEQQKSVRCLDEYRKEATEVLQKSGARRFDPRPPLGVGLCPEQLKRLLGLSFERPICKYNDLVGGWTIAVATG